MALTPRRQVNKWCMKHKEEGKQQEEKIKLVSGKQMMHETQRGK